MFIEIIKHTPIWVFALLAGLILLGYSRTKTRQVSKGRLIVLPAAMMLLSLNGVWSAFGARPLGFLAWACGIVLAVSAGRLLIQPRDGSYSPVAGRYTVPGSWWPMVLILVIFFTKYAVAVVMAMNPALAGSAGLVATASLAYGLFSGTFLVRALHTLRGAVAPAGLAQGS